MDSVTESTIERDRPNFRTTFKKLYGGKLSTLYTRDKNLDHFETVYIKKHWKLSISIFRYTKDWQTTFSRQYLGTLWKVNESDDTVSPTCIHETIHHVRL